MHAVCEMMHVATVVVRSVVYVSVCRCVRVLVMLIYCAKTAEPIEMPFGG